MYIILFSFFLLWNYWQPFTADDYGYMFSKIGISYQLIEVLKQRYIGWSGRLSADALVYIFLNKNTLLYMLPIINLLSAFSILISLHFICKFIFSKSYSTLAFISCSLFYLLFEILIKTFAQNFLWKTVAIQYAWGFALVLWLIDRFFKILNYQKRITWYETLIYGICGVFIGCYNEIYVAFIVDIYLATAIIFVIFKKNLKQLVNVPIIIFFLSTIISGILSISAPGNFVRRSTYIVEHNIPSHINIFYKFLMTYVQFFRYGYHAILAIVILYIGYWSYKNKNKIAQNNLMHLMFLIILLNLHLLSFVEIAYYSPIAGRMLIFMDTIIFCLIYKFILIICEINNINIVNSSKVFKHYMSGGLLILLLTVTAAYYNLHQFIKMQQQLVISNLMGSYDDSTTHPYNDNAIFGYIVYYDNMRTYKIDFIKFYTTSLSKP